MLLFLFMLVLSIGTYLVQLWLVGWFFSMVTRDRWDVLLLKTKIDFKWIFLRKGLVIDT